MGTFILKSDFLIISLAGDFTERCKERPLK